MTTEITEPIVQPLPILDYLTEREGQVWTAEDTARVREHMRKVDALWTELVRAAKEGRLK